MSNERSLFQRIGVLFSVIALDLICFGIVVPILPFYAVQFGANATVLGFLLMSYSAMQFLFAPLWGSLSDRIGRKKVLLISTAGMGLSLLILGFAKDLVLLFAARILAGMFAANIGVASAYVTDVTEGAERTRGMGFIGAAFGIGFLLGPALGGLLSPYGYQIPILFAAVLAALNMIYAILALREPQRHEETESTLLPEKLSNRPALKLYFLFFLFTVSVNQLESIFALFMLDRFAFNAREVASILVLMAGVMIFVQTGPIRSLVTRLGEKRLLLIGSLLIAVSFFLIPFSYAVSFLLLPLLVAAVGRGLSQPSLMSWVSQLARSHRRGAMMGSLQSFGSLGRVVGPLVAGILYDRNQGFPFFFAASLMAVVFLAGLSQHQAAEQKG